jgi:hypothetical protein
MDLYSLKQYVNKYVSTHIIYNDGLSNPLPVSHSGWLLYSKNCNNFCLAFYDSMGSLDYLPIFTHDEVDSLYVQDASKILDMNLVPPEWVDNSAAQLKEPSSDGMTEKGSYQNSGFNWL